MKDIIEVYSDAIVSVICAVAVITLFVNIMTEYKDIILAFLNQIIYRYLLTLVCNIRGENMKNIIETSCYLLIMTIICYISLEFIIMNTEIADVGKMQQYVSHYIEIYGKTQKNNDELDSAVFDTIYNAAKDRGMSVTCQYETQTENYKYYRVSVSKNIGIKLMSLNRLYTSECLVKCKA